jgi:hypothetical protein
MIDAEKARKPKKPNLGGQIRATAGGIRLLRLSVGGA